MIGRQVVFSNGVVGVVVTHRPPVVFVYCDMDQMENVEGIVKVLDTFEHEGQHHIVMAYIAGGSLRDMLTQGAQLPLEQVLNIALELADALSRSHHLGIIHRDLKPGNVLLTEDGTPCLTDFGIARLMRDDVRLTQSGVFLGSPAYASPEILNGEEPNVDSDIWSFGALLYEMLAGQPPFTGKTITAVTAEIMPEPVPPITQFRADVPTPHWQGSRPVRADPGTQQRTER